MGIRQPPAGSSLVLVKVFSQHVWWKRELMFDAVHHHCC